MAIADNKGDDALGRRLLSGRFCSTWAGFFSISLGRFLSVRVSETDLSPVRGHLIGFARAPHAPLVYWPYGRHHAPGPILRRFRDIAGLLLRKATPLFQPNFGVTVTSDLDCRCCGSEELRSIP